MTQFRKFHQGCEYRSFYPYYLPSFYSGFFLPPPEPESYKERRFYDRYFQPVTHEHLTIQPINDCQPNNPTAMWMYIALIIVALFFLARVKGF